MVKLHMLQAEDLKDSEGQMHLLQGAMVSQLLSVSNKESEKGPKTLLGGFDEVCRLYIYLNP